MDGGSYALFTIVFFFSLAFPSAKILIALWAWVLAGYDQDRMRKVMVFFAAVSKWSMLDVFRQRCYCMIRSPMNAARPPNKMAPNTTA